MININFTSTYSLVKILSVLAVFGLWQVGETLYWLYSNLHWGGL